MDFVHGIIALVAGIVLVLTGLVAWMYIQQSRMAQAINALAVAVTAPPASFMVPESQLEPEPEPEPEPEQEQEPEPRPEHVPEQEQEHEQDDRVSVHEDEHAGEEETGAVGEDISDFSGKTVAQLRELLTAKGIPYSKSDKKPVLLSLVQAAA